VQHLRAGRSEERAQLARLREALAELLDLALGEAPNSTALAERARVLAVARLV